MFIVIKNKAAEERNMGLNEVAELIINAPTGKWCYMIPHLAYFLGQNFFLDALTEQVIARVHHILIHTLVLLKGEIPTRHNFFCIVV